MKLKFFVTTFVLLYASMSFADYNRDFGEYSNKIYNSTVEDTKGNDIFGSRYRFANDFSYEQEGSIPYAAHIGTDNIIEVTAFKKYTIAQVTASLAMNEANTDALGRFHRKTVFFNTVYWGDGSTQLILKSFEKTLWSSKDSSGKEKYSVYQSYTQTFPLPIGPIPFAVTAGFKGAAGIRGDLKLKAAASASLELEFGPYVDVDALASADVNVLIAKGTAEANLTLLDAEQKLKSSLHTSILNQTANFKFDLPGQVSSLDGSVSLNGYIRSVKICTWNLGWFEIKYPCGLTWAQVGSWTLIDWEGYVKSWNLYSYSKDFAL